MKYNVFLVFIVVLISGCSSTQLVTSWKKDDYPGKKFSKIGVVAFAKNKSTRLAVERAVVVELKARGINAIPTIDVFPAAGEVKETQQLDEQMIKKAVVNAGLDGMLTISLLHVSEDTRYIPGEVRYEPRYGYPMYGHPYYGYPYYRYYGYTYRRVQEPGHYETSKSYFVESNFFDVNTEKMVWTGQTRTMDPTDIEDAATGYAKVIVKDLIEEGVIMN